MQLEAALDHLLNQYMHRAQVRAGNGLTKSMNTSLRSYPQLPLIISRSVECLAALEYFFGLEGTVSVNCHDLYHILIHTHEDWHHEVPALQTAGNGYGSVTFVRQPRLPRHQFTAAWAIARRIRLLTGHGALRLHGEALDQFRRLIRSPSQKQWHDKA